MTKRPPFTITWTIGEEVKELVKLFHDGSFWADWDQIMESCRVNPLSDDLGPMPCIIHLLLAVKLEKNTRVN